MTETIHVVVMGVSGSGKTTVAGILQDRWGWQLAEADDFHPQSNIDKMHSGIPLTDYDRWPWLETIRTWMTEHEEAGRSTIVTCSALKKTYRDVLRRGAARVIFMHLDGDHALLASRLATRTDHFMPSSLLDSQFATLEQLQPDELGAVIDIAGTPAQIATTIERKIELMTSPGRMPEGSAAVSVSRAGVAVADVGVYGLGTMGSALARNLAGHFTTAVMNVDSARTDRFMALHGSEGDFVATASSAEFIAALRRPRKILLVVTAGVAVDSVIAQLSAYLESGDIVVDMGNSHFEDTRRREALLRQRGIRFVGCGISGGERGALNGPALMVGGTAAAWEQLKPILEPIAARADDGASCAVHVGADGAGHLAKIVHNGIEYAQMEVIAEVYHLLRRTLGLTNRQAADVFEQWNRGELNSYLLEISAAVLRAGADGDFIEQISDRASHKGTGAWSTMIGVDLGVDVSMLAGALFARFASTSRLRGKLGYAAGTAAGQSGVGVHDAGGELTTDDLRQAMWLAKLVSYVQGLEVIRAASERYGWNIDLAGVCRGWRAGCIIRCAMLDELSELLEFGDPMGVLVKNAERVLGLLPALRKVIGAAGAAQSPAADLAAALAYLDQAREQRLPTALIQAQRDFFGAHGFELEGQEGIFHGPWKHID
ncbi:NADP-dependent phosphogluconate dehydrogenase [Trueperella pyogenes]|uniref:NADP-dependent phosphogluconate dehydrogenase n=1 Tax=Trueperella pyogenes TaxID=1661 RepID=UPI0032440E5C